MATTTLSSSTSPSIRSSCERCRSLKLKCRVVESPGDTLYCQRCARAMVPCIFARRSKSKRSAAMSSKQPNNPCTASASPKKADPPSIPAQPIPPPTGFSTFSEDEMQYTHHIPAETAGPESLIERTIELFPAIQGYDELSVQDHSSMKEMYPGKMDSDPFQSTSNEGKTVGDLQAFAGNIASPEFYFDVHSGMADCNAMPSFVPSYGSVTSSGDTTSTLSDLPALENWVQWPNETPSTRRGVATRTLLDFAAGLHERLELLCNGTWLRDCAVQTMDDYPIGSVLNLSQRFTSIVNAFRRAESGYASHPVSGLDTRDAQKACCTRHTSMADSDLATPRASSASSDISATLFLLGCYVMLVRVATVVFADFQAHLTYRPPSPRPSVIPTSMAPDSTICFGQLPPINAAHHRIHTAVLLLLSSLEDAEKAIGLPRRIGNANGSQWSEGSSERNSTPCSPGESSGEEDSLGAALPHWALTVSGTGMEEALSNLEVNVVAVKKLLRQHMGL